jgi:N-acetylglucosaminyl-diphospho-decaprenol L-rhamnosyltransferase
MAATAPVSVVVVSYNTREKLAQCLRCIETSHEVIVVDNASVDGSPEMVAAEFPHVHLVANEENRGFGAANNQGAAIASGEWILYLNSDCYASPGAIAGLAEMLAHGGAVAGGGRLLNVDGSLQESVAAELSLWMVFLEQTFLERPLRRFGLGYWRTKQALARAAEGSVEVDQVMGACLLVKNGLELFDERFFLYCEDTDLCKRLKGHGTILYVPSFEFVHELGSSSANNRWLSVARYNLGKELYFEIHHGRLARRVCWVLNRFGAALRLVVWALLSLVRPSKRVQVQLFWRVLTARGIDRL